MKIRTWSFSYNNYEDWKIGNVQCVERPLWVHLGSWFVGSVLGRGCCLLHWVKFPSWVKVIRDECTYTAKEYYGDLGSVYSVEVFCPIFDWWWKIEKRNQKEWVVKIGYEKLREIFGSDFKELEPIRTSEDE
jgi:hypothetical protein